MAEDGKRRIVGLDIGTNKVAAIIGEVLPDGAIEVIGVGTHASGGLRKGVVVNVESTVQSIQRAVEEAELMAGAPIEAVYAGVGGSHIGCVNSDGVVPITSGEVRRQDIEAVMQAASAVPTPADQRILHVLPQDYVVDGQEGVRKPLGMSGVRLEAGAHVVTCAANAARNVEKCIERCGLRVHRLVPAPLASSHAVLTNDERDLGVCLVDIGAGTTDITVFANGAIRRTAVIPIAGDQVTNDIAMSLPTPKREAEEIKIKYACALTRLVQPDETINVAGVGDRPPRPLPRQAIAEIVEARLEELFGFVKEELRVNGFEESVAAGVVLTGGGARMEGLAELAESVFEMPASVAAPKHVGGLQDIVRNPLYATGVGLLILGKREEDESSGDGRSRSSGLLGRIGSWFRENV